MATAKIYIAKNGAWYDVKTGIPLDAPITATATSLISVLPANPRDSLVLGSYVPGAGTAGLLTTTAAFTDVYGDANGNIYIDKPGIFVSVRYWGKVICRTTEPCYFNNCAFYNRKPEDMYAAGASGNGGCIQNYGSAPPHIFLTDCQINPKGWFDAGKSASWGHPVQVGIHGGNFTARRCEFVNCQDGVNYVGPNVEAAAAAASCLMEGCWIHKAFYLKPWSGPGAPASGDTHSDGFQFNTGRNITLRYNFIGGPRDMTGYNATPGYNSGEDNKNAGIMIQQEGNTTALAAVRNVLIENNWLAGGGATINAYYKNGNTGYDWIIRNNKIGTRNNNGLTYGGAGFSIYNKSGLAIPYSGNVNWDGPSANINGTGVAAPIYTY